jgi:Holliday junction DNA helicase RuvA
MIDSLRGTVTEMGDDFVVVQVGPVGLRVSVTAGVLESVRGAGQKIELLTYMDLRGSSHDVSLTLYGFVDKEERRIFEMLLNVSGVGSRVALAIISTISTLQIRNAVGREEPEIFTRAPGVGKKTAQKIILELKDKLKSESAFLAEAPVSDTDTDVLGALTALGYSLVEAQAALASVPRDAPDDVEERVRLALQYFL